MEDRTLPFKLSRQGYEDLARLLMAHVAEERALVSPRSKFLDSMLQAVLEAFRNPHPKVRVGTILGRSSCTALFICESTDDVTLFPSCSTTPSFVGDDDHNVYADVSMQVEVRSKTDRDLPQLYTSKWSNGLWFATSPRRPVLFPLNLDFG